MRSSPEVVLAGLVAGACAALGVAAASTRPAASAASTVPAGSAVWTVASASRAAPGPAAGPSAPGRSTPWRAARAGEPFYGTFYLLPSEGDDIEEVIDRGVSLVEGWFRRPFARGRIREVTEPLDWFQLFRVADSVRANTPAWTMTVPRDGALQGWEREPGDSIDVTIEWDGEAWVHTLEAEDGTRVNRYRLMEDGERLLFDVTLTSDRLRAPLDFELVFERR